MLVSEGDVSLTERRAVFNAKRGRPTALNDEQFILAIAATTDDDDDEFSVCVEKVENNDYEIAATAA